MYIYIYERKPTYNTNILTVNSNSNNIAQDQRTSSHTSSHSKLWQSVQFHQEKATIYTYII